MSAPFLNGELYGLTAQVRRPAWSVPVNIAEEIGGGTQPELGRFCRISRGSFNELEYHLLLARDLGHLSPGAHAPVGLRCSAEC